MGRKCCFLLTVGILLGALTGLAAADFSGEVPQGVADEQMSAGAHFAAVGGVADYWPEETPGAMAQERGPVETGALPATSEGSANDVPTVEIGGSVYRVGIDEGP